VEEDELICGNSICAGFVSANWLWREKFPAPLKRVGEENKKMVMTDPIADMLTRIRNAIQAKKEQVDMPASRFKLELARILKAEGYIKNFKLIQEDKKDTLRISLNMTRTTILLFSACKKSAPVEEGCMCQWTKSLCSGKEWE